MTTTAERPARTIRPGLVTVAAIAACVVAVALALIPAVPVLLRSLIVVPAMVLIAGQATTPLVIGRLRGANDELDRVLRAVLPVLLGMIALLGSVLATALIGFDLDTTSISIGVASLAIALVLLSRWRTITPGAARSDVGPPPLALPRAATIRTGAGVVVSVLVLAAAVAGAIALIPTPSASYSLVTLDDQAVLAGNPLQVTAGASTELHWTLRSFGYQLGDTGSTATVTIGGTPAAGVRTSIQPASGGRPDDVGATSRQSGTATFTAPATPGLYDVRLVVSDPTAPGGPGSDPAPAELVVTMQVTA